MQGLIDGYFGKLTNEAIRASSKTAIVTLGQLVSVWHSAYDLVATISSDVLHETFVEYLPPAAKAEVDTALVKITSILAPIKSCQAYTFILVD